MTSIKTFITVLAVILAIGGIAEAQSENAQSQKTIAQSMDVYVFPTKGQDAAQQSQDEATCYGWAVDQTGLDAFNLQKQAQQQQQQAGYAKQQAAQAGQGAGARGAAGGAAAGALIGSLSADAGKGAAIGAAVGGLAGRSARRQAQAEASRQVEQSAAKQQAATAEQMENFKNAFAVCLEAADYMVRF
jgi:hypothetical protein